MLRSIGSRSGARAGIGRARLAEGRDLAKVGAGPGAGKLWEPNSGACSWEEQALTEWAGPGEPGRGRARWQGEPGTPRGWARQRGAGPGGRAPRGCGRLFRAEAPPLPSSPPVPSLEGASSDRRGGIQAAVLARCSRELANVERDDPDPHRSRSLCPAGPSRHVPQQASCGGPAAAARGQRDLQVSAGLSRPQAQPGWAAGQGREPAVGLHSG